VFDNVDVRHLRCFRTNDYSRVPRQSDWIVLNFSDPLKEIATSFGFKSNEIYGTQEQKLAINENLGVSGREFLQKFGTNICRDLLPQVMPNLKLEGNTIWVQLMKNKIACLHKNWRSKIIVGDCRFPDEVKLIKDLGGQIVKIHRATNNNSTNDVTVNAHASEQHINQLPYDILIENDSTEANFYAKCHDFLFPKPVPNDNIAREMEKYY
jgi:hypothetical protein